MRSSRFLIPSLVLALGLGSLALASDPTPTTASAPAKRKAHKARAGKKSVKKKIVTPAHRKRLVRAFVASRELRPMAHQLLQARTPAAYAAVEHFALAHVADDAGALAWLVIGYAHILDGEHALAVDPLRLAKPRAADLGDYVDYYLATAYAGSNRPQDALTTLKDFATRYPDSLLTRDAQVTLANAMVASGNAAQAVSLLEPGRTPLRADVELALGRAWASTGERDRAVDALYRVFYTMANSDEAEAANLELQTLAKSGPVAPPGTSLRRTRADLLLQNRRATDAVPEYQALLQQASEAEVRSLQIALAVAFYRSGKSKEASDLLAQMADQPDEINAQRLFYQLEIARPDELKVSDLITAMRTSASNSPWFQDALLSAANTYLLQKDYEPAARLYEELAQRSGDGKYGPYATWKTAWLQLRLGKQTEAASTLERYIDLYPYGSELTAALYWRGRIAEDQKDLAKASAYYGKIGERFYNAYYADLARARLRNIDSSVKAADEPLLEKISTRAAAKINLASPPDDLRVQKSRLLENAGLVDLAVRELQAAAGSNSEWLAGETARLYSDSGKYYRALQTVKRAVPGYNSFQLSELPRPVWEYLFPKPYWDDLRRYASANGLDPFLVASLIRQESEFNAAALSRANAMGLMQILPGTGKKVAKELKIKGFDSALLLDPTYNLQVGTRYFSDLLKRYDGRIEYALAAYNAGPERVDEWRKDSYRDMPEFVESIPFTETREYVQAIVRNASLYQRLYPNP